MSTSTERNPVHNYTAAGVYSVTLTVFGAGGTDSYTRINYITVTTPTYVLTANIYPPGSAIITGLGTYSYGDLVTLTAFPQLKPADEAYCDIVFLVDESGTMATEHAWLLTLPTTLNAALVAANIGAGVNPNNYALVGFGGHINPAHKHTVGGGDWGTAAECDTAAGGLFLGGGGTEDGYEACYFALNNYTYRGDAIKVYILITDEERHDITGGTVTKASITADLQSSGVILASCLNLSITDTLAQPAIGRKGTTVYTGTLIPPYYTTGTLLSLVAGPGGGTTVADYCDVTDVVPAPQPDGGTSWDLNILRLGGAEAVSFTSAFTDILKDQVSAVLYYTFSYWVINGSPVYTNPYIFNITMPTTIDLYMV